MEEDEDEPPQGQKGDTDIENNDEDEDDDDDQGSPNLLKFKKHSRPPSSQISQMSQLDIDFFKTRKRIRR